MLRLDEYSYIDSEKPFAVVKFVYDDIKISFTVRNGEEMTIEVDDEIPVAVVLEAIKIVQSRTLTF